ncbi:MAG: DNA helicase RecQ [Chlamydiales bacterium]|nr:DNA helicase RecQ [Chlamydiales bacterium]
MNNTAVSLEEELKRYFGYNTFRPFQTEIIHALMQKRDVLAILPTGAGKSLCYQLPAMLMPGIAIVVSPLISLMQDQVVSLFKNGISAAFVNSSLPPNEIREVLENLSDYKMIYVAPERLVDPDFLEHLKKVQVSFFVIDEAHCISQWGHSFRVEYRKLSLLKEVFPACPVIALTATATHDVEKDIQTQLAMKNPTLIKGSFDRPNLMIRALAKQKPEQQLMAFLKEHENQSGIIYASTRKGVDITYNALSRAGYSVGRYHAGMSEQDRSAMQNAFLHDETTLMVATVAFGMGIHKPDVRFIVHMDMPKSIEQYYQEIGRAGRDGLPAECLMLYGVQDLLVYKSFLEQIDDPAIRQLTRQKTDSMYRYCTSFTCRRFDLLKYFGEKYTKGPCSSCDICLAEFDQIDGTLISQKILSCVFRLKQNAGIRMLTEVLRASKNQAILDRHYDELSTYGLLKEMSEQEVRYYIESLIHQGYLQLSEGEYPVVQWTEKSPTAVKGQESILFIKKVFKAPKEERERFKKSQTQVIEYNDEIFQALRALRLEIARDECVPPFVVFSDRALQEMAAHIPTTQDEFCRINGVGPIKWLKYGKPFLKALSAFKK